MLPLLADEDFRWAIAHGLRIRQPALDLVRAQEVGLIATADRLVLDWAAREGRILLTHDYRTMIGFAYARVRQGLPMPGVFAMRQTIPTRRAIDDLLILVECSLENEWEGQMLHLPI